jgi:sugar phosphate permease
MSRWAVLALVTLAHALGALSVLSVAPLAPLLLEAFTLTRAQVGLLVPAVYLGGVLMSLPAGWVTDRLGVRLTLALGQLLIGVMVLAGAGADRLPALLVLLVLAGFGFSVLNPASGKAVLEWFPPRGRGFAMGFKQTGLTLGGLTAALTLPPLAVAHGWRFALAAAGTVSLVSSALVALLYRTPPGSAASTVADRPSLRDLRVFLGRPGVLVVLGSGFALSVAQASVLAHTALFARETFEVSTVTAARVLAAAQLGGTAARLGWGGVSDRFFGGRRRPGVVASALVATAAYAVFALGDRLPVAVLAPVALVAGAGAFGWVGLYFALVAEIGGARHAGLLTGVAVAFSWSGVLVGPPLFGLAVDTTGSYTAPWLLLGAVSVLVALALPRPAPLVERG